MNMTFLWLPLLLTSAQDPAPATKLDPAVERLEVMKTSVQMYTFSRDGGPLKLQAEPAFRLGNQGNGGVLEGAIFLWTDEVGRPDAAAQVFLHRYAGKPEGQWLHEFTSLSTGTFVVTGRGARWWSPTEPGVTFKPLPGAPKPAATASGRLRQMRSLAEDFKAEDNFGDKGRYEVLRLLTTPVARYGRPGAIPEDGGLFAFVEGTDPEVLLFLEVRAGTAGPEWQYACAPMSCWPLRVIHKGQLVWQLPLRDTSNPSKPFFSRAYFP